MNHHYLLHYHQSHLQNLKASNILYMVPPIQQKKITDISLPPRQFDLSLNTIPDCLTSHVAIPYTHFKELGNYCPNSKNSALLFSGTLPVSSLIRLYTLQTLLNHGSPFSSMMNASVLYGVEPISGVLLRNISNIYFLQGFQVNDTNNSQKSIDLIP